MRVCGGGSLPQDSTSGVLRSVCLCVPWLILGPPSLTNKLPDKQNN